MPSSPGGSRSCTLDSSVFLASCARMIATAIHVAAAAGLGGMAGLLGGLFGHRWRGASLPFEPTVRCRLSAGGKWIRTIGSRRPATPWAPPSTTRRKEKSDADTLAREESLLEESGSELLVPRQGIVVAPRWTPSYENFRQRIRRSRRILRSPGSVLIHIDHANCVDFPGLKA